MGFTIISINWTGQAFSPQQMLVLRDAAVKYLREGRSIPELHFSHELCEGKLERKQEGVFGTFGGTFFAADLGLIGGERWTIVFLIPRGTEELPLADSSVILSEKPMQLGLSRQAAAAKRGGKIDSRRLN